MTTTTQDPDRPLRGRRLSWQEFFAIRPDLKAVNDNQKPVDNQNPPAEMREGFSRLKIL